MVQNENPQTAGLTYAKAGVDIEAGDAVVERIRPAVEQTRRPEVLDSIGGFGGLFALDTSRYKQPVMVTATDGVGTKLDLARKMSKHDTVGIDLVAMVVDDIVVSGAEPVVFLDYIAIGKLDQNTVTDLVVGIAEGCKEAGCSLVGGETAEHPGIMPAGDYDLAGFGVGLVERDKILSKDNVKDGDVLVAMESSGIHSNGFSLVRAIIDGKDLNKDPDGALGKTLGEALLEPTKIYTKACLELVEKGLVHCLCHITGGGLIGNLPRVLPNHLGVTVNLSTWQIPALFSWLIKEGNVAREEAFKAFNMGVGMVAICSKEQAQEVISTCHNYGIESWLLGAVEPTAGIRLK